MNTLRIDKWLWAARFFKTRSLAARACELGRVRMAGQPVKPAREVHAGSQLRVETEGGEYEIEVIALSDVRGPATAARTLYNESDESVARRAQVARERRASREFEVLPTGRPAKRDRRKLREIRGRA